MRNTRLFFIFAAMLLIMGDNANAQDLIPDKNNKGKWGFIDSSGKKVINYDFDEATAFEDGRAKVCKNNKWGYIDTKGKEVIKIKYSEMGTWEDGRCKIAEGGSFKDGILSGAKWGFIRRNGEYALKPEFDFISPFNNDIASVKKGNKYGYINSRFSEIIPCKFSAVGSFNDKGFCWVQDGSKYGIYNSRGTEIIPPKYKNIGTFNAELIEANPLYAKMTRNPEAMAVIKKMKDKVKKKSFTAGFKMGLTGGFGFKKTSAKDVIEQTRELEREANDAIQDDLQDVFDAALTTEERAIMAECGSFDLLSYTFISGTPFEPLDMSKSDYFVVSNQNPIVLADRTSPRTSLSMMELDKPGIFDSRGRELLPVGKYSIALSPSEGHVPVANIKKGKFVVNYYRTSSGEVIFKNWLEATTLTPFVDGYAIIADDEYQYLVNRNGKKVSDEYTIICPPKEGIYLVGGRHGYGLLDNTGREVLAPSFNLILPQSDKLFCAQSKRDSKFGYLNATGKFEIPELYDEARSFSNGFAAVKKETGWGMISTNNDTKINYNWDDIINITDENPELVWTRKGNQWHACTPEQNTVKFTTEFTPLSNFAENGMATISYSQHFGAININGDIVVPIGLQNVELLEKCYNHMAERGINIMPQIDVYRFNIFANPDRHTYNLVDRINSEMWDF